MPYPKHCLIRAPPGWGEKVPHPEQMIPGGGGGGGEEAAHRSQASYNLYRIYSTHPWGSHQKDGSKMLPRITLPPKHFSVPVSDTRINPFPAALYRNLNIRLQLPGNLSSQRYKVKVGSCIQTHAINMIDVHRFFSGVPRLQKTLYIPFLSQPETDF